MTSFEIKILFPMSLEILSIWMEIKMVQNRKMYYWNDIQYNVEKLFVIIEDIKLHILKHNYEHFIEKSHYNFQAYITYIFVNGVSKFLYPCIRWYGSIKQTAGGQTK